MGALPGNSFCGPCCAKLEQCIADCNVPTCSGDQVISCWGLCSDSSRIGNGVCDEDLNCAQTNNDGGDCGGGCGPGETPCGDGTCVADDKVCDGITHCSTGSDEDPAICGTGATCEPNEFQCGDTCVFRRHWSATGKPTVRTTPTRRTAEEQAKGEAFPRATAAIRTWETEVRGVTPRTCADAVCASGMEYCCIVTWDETCAMMANDICTDVCSTGPSNGSDCCTSSSSPGW